MDGNGFIAVLLVFLLIADVSSLRIDLKTRKLAASGPANSSAPVQVPPLPNDVPVAKKSDPKSSGADGSNGTSSQVTKDSLSPDNATPNVTVTPGPPSTVPVDNKSDNKKEEDQKKSGQEIDKKPSPPQGEEVNKKPSPPQGKDTDKKSSPPQGEDTDKKPSPPKGKDVDKVPSPPEAKAIDKKLSPPEAEEIDKKPGSSAGVPENCDGKDKKCQISNTLTGCIWISESDSQELEILVQNDGQETLKVDLTVPTSEKDNKKDVVVLKDQITKIKISNIIGKASEIVLSTGNKKCNIDVGTPLPDENSLFHLPTTEQLLTPVNGAYFLIATVVTFGGIWACCKFTKRRRHGSVPYQELEMASPETASAANVETAEGWDQGWDDDWDEENSVKSPVVRLHAGNISANGLTSRPANRDGWDNDWDD